MIKILREIYPSILLCTIAILLCVSVVFSQTDECKDKEKKKSTKSVNKEENKNKDSNNKRNYPVRVTTKPKPNIKTNVAPRFIFRTPTNISSRNEIKSPRDSAEKSILVNEKVNISFCVSKGNVKINGWNRNEIRAFVDGSKEIGLEVIEKSKHNEKPVWVKVLGYDPANNRGRRNQCLSGKVIELDVPFGAVIDTKGGVGGTMIDSVLRVKLKNVGGDVMLNNIKDGINAINFEGNIIVNKSGGSMTLETTTGNIVAVGASASDFGDTFRAKTNSGAVVLQNLEYKQAEIYSNSGSVKFVGDVLSNSQHEFITTDGSITLVVPKDTCAALIANYGGSFSSKIPLKDVIKGGNSTLRSLTATMGKGCAKLIFKTYNGAISIDIQ